MIDYYYNNNNTYVWLLSFQLELPTAGPNQIERLPLRDVNISAAHKHLDDSSMGHDDDIGLFGVTRLLEGLLQSLQDLLLSPCARRQRRLWARLDIPPRMQQGDLVVKFGELIDELFARRARVARQVVNFLQIRI